MVLYRTAPVPANPQAGSDKRMTVQQFKQWIKSIDRDGDGMISRQELRDALRTLGMSCTRWKAWCALVNADLNHNKHIDGDAEVEEFVRYAAKSWGIIVS